MERGDRVMVMSAWALAGGVLGSLVGLVGLIDGQTVDPAYYGAVGSVGAFVLGGAASVLAARLGDVVVVDHRGRRVREPHWLLLGLPIMVSIPSLLGLGALAAAWTGKWLAGLLFWGLAIGVGVGGRRMGSRWRLATALAILEGDREAGERSLGRLETSRWVTPHVRRVARWNLGLKRLQAGELDAAAQRLAMAGEGRVQSFAAVSLGLVRVLQGRNEAALRCLGQVGAGGPVASAQADGVRLLLVLRRDGVASGRAVAERLSDPRASALSLGLLAWARWRSGDEVGALEVLEPGLIHRLAAEGLEPVVKELGEVLAWHRSLST